MVLYLLILVISFMLASRVQVNEPFCPDDRRRNLYRQNQMDRQGMVNRISLTVLILFLSSFCVLRIHTGNDYQTYINHFHDIVSGNYVVTEYGFNWVVKAVYWFLDEENYLVVFGIFGFLTTFLFVLEIYKQSCDFQMSFFLFMVLGLYFQTYNTVRYYFALSIVVMSMRFVTRGEYGKFILAVLVAALFHKTALVVIPLYLMAKISWKKWMLVVLSAVALTGLFMEDLYMKIFLRLYPSYLHEEEYLAGSGFSYVNIARCLAVLILAIYLNYRYGILREETMRFYFYLNLAALALYSCFSFIPFVSRIGYYLNISHIFFLPAMLKALPQGKIKTAYKTIIMMAGLLYFMVFLQRADAVNVRILPYTSWLYEDIQMTPLFHR